ncbi:la-related protein 7 [Danaus plexippus]|uniref:la-related protein 7 n=1 Tax=Danaus plexippus TaxID=13037 RepID=UPI002AB2FDDA|nr:la-related protein 7 [Danaus plexippus]
MSESESAEVIEETKLDNSPRKRVRHRKKQIYENIMKQMEFYFSDANLSKDRFLGDLVKNDPYVPITEFLKFNKIRSMTQDVGDIVKAMKHSTFLELSEDKTKVARKTPMLPYDADQRTIYVESIPVTASLNWLDRVFSDYGQVAYISLPKFKNSQKNKGFAFIEFASPQDAQNCISTFTKMGCKLPSCMPPEELSSIKMFSAEPAELSENNYEPPKKKSKKIKEKKPKSLDLKQDESDSEKNLDTPTEESKENISTACEETKITDAESKDDITSHDEMTDEVPRKKKVKKRSSKEKGKSKALAKGEVSKGALWGLQVLPKCEWKALRNKYLNLQRKYMKEIKSNWQNRKHTYPGILPPDPAIEVPVNTTPDIESGKNLEPLQKIPGVFVKENLKEPCLDVRLLKRTIKTNIHVLHVEAKEGQSEVIIRFDSSKAADEYCTSNTHALVLRGSDEQEQWRRAESARACKRTRGRTRVLARTAPHTLAPASPQPTHTHIRFDE